MISTWQKINWKKYFSCHVLYVLSLMLKPFNIRSLSLYYIPMLSCFKIGYTDEDNWTFCKSESEILIHPFFNCVYSRLFRKDFEFYYYSVLNKLFNLSLQDVLIGIIIWQGKSERSDWFFPGRDFAIRTVSVETVISCVFFCFRKPENSKQTWPECHIINYLLT